MKKNNFEIIKFLALSIFISLIVIPMTFNFLFLWDSGLAHGNLEDWFTLYGSIFGGLIGGFFTYLALLYTLKHDKEKLESEKNVLIKDSVLVIHEYISKIGKQIIELGDYIHEREFDEMNEQYEKNYDKFKEDDIFDCERIKIKNLDGYLNTLKHMNKNIGKLKEETRIRYINLKSIDDKDLHNFIFDCYLVLSHYEEYIDEIIENGNFNLKEFVYQINPIEYKLGLRGVVHTIRDEVSIKYYPKYIRTNNDHVGNIFREVINIHIRG